MDSENTEDANIIHRTQGSGVDQIESTITAMLECHRPSWNISYVMRYLEHYSGLARAPKRIRHVEVHHWLWWGGKLEGTRA